jgi:hypothetical protein
MSKRLNINDLPEQVREQLEVITSIPAESLSNEEIAFLRARRDYLRPEQKEVYASVLGAKAPVAPSAPVEEPTVAFVHTTEIEEEVTEELEEGQVKVIVPKNYTKAVLMQMANDAGLEVSEEMTKKEIAEAITNKIN